MRLLIMFVLVLLGTSCGGGGSIVAGEQQQPPISGSGYPTDLVPNNEPPKPPGTPLGSSVPIQLTIIPPDQFAAFDVYAWNDALRQYTFFWQFEGGTQTIDVLYTPDKEHEIHLQFPSFPDGAHWTRYDLIAGTTSITLGDS